MWALEWVRGLAWRQITGSLALERPNRARYAAYAAAAATAAADIAAVGGEAAAIASEIAATLRAAKSMAHGRLLCFFEPHTYSRTAALWDGFTRCFEEADAVYFMHNYAAREENVYGVSSEKLAAATPNAGYIASYSQAAETIRRDARPGDTVMILGAGTVDHVAELLKENE